MDFNQLKENLEQFISEQSGKQAVITNAKPLAGGASRDTWFFDATLDGESQQWVMRRDFPTQMSESALTREQEFRLMDSAYQHGVKVAKMRWLCTDKSVLGSDFFIMDYVPGISVGRKVVQLPELAQARQKLPEQLAEQLARIHTLDVENYDLDFLQRPPDGVSPAQQVVQLTYEVLDSLQIKNPVWEWTLRWAERHLPPDNRRTFVHGDYRIGNLLVDAEGLTAVIDWEFGHIGDPLEDIGYPCGRDWRFGMGHLHYGGISDRETFIMAYERYSGETVNRDAVTWWEIMGDIRWGVICMSQANRHLSGKDPSVELASLGRRSVEMQLESLRLIEQYGL